MGQSRHTSATPWKTEFAQPTSEERKAIDWYLATTETKQPATPRDPLEKTVKKGQHREVGRLTHPGADIHIKKNHLHNLRARLRRMLRPAKAQLEFDTLQKLKKLGIASVEPLAWAENRSGESLLFTRTIDQAQTLDEIHSRQYLNMDPRTKGLIAREFGRLLAGMHQAGLFHPDPHPGNLLWSGENEPLRIMDLHQVREKATATDQDRCADLAAWAAWSDLRLSATDNLRLLKRYAQSFEKNRFSPGVLRSMVKEIRTRLEKIQTRFWRNQGALCLTGGHRRFARFRHGSCVGMSLGNKKDLLKTISQLPGPGKPLPQGAKVLKESKSSRVFRITIPEHPDGKTQDPGEDLIVKQVPWKKKWGATLGRLLGLDPVRRSWYWTNALRLRLLPTPVSQGFFLNNKGRYSVQVTSVIPEALQLDQWVDRHGGDFVPLSQMVKKVARLIRRLHQRGLQHRDLKAANILVDGEGQPWFVDLAGVGFSPSGAKDKKAKALRDLGRIATSFWNNSKISNGLRLRFLKTYLWSLSDFGLDWKELWRSLRQTAEQRTQKNLEKGRPLG